MNTIDVQKNKISAFLARCGFPVHGPDINHLIDGLLYDMQTGLDRGPGSGHLDASMEMIPTWSIPSSKAPRSESFIVIDAGGTNFRSCLVTFDQDGKTSISDLEKRSMPGIDREYSKKEFFDTIASYLDHLKNKSRRIGFCFSYAMEITDEGDGRVIKFSKEIKAREVEGSLVGASLVQSLQERGWDPIEKIVLLNDTAAALYSGVSLGVNGRSFSSYLGLILGTGMNIAYIESGEIQKIKKLTHKQGFTVPHQQVIVCEAGKYNKIAQSHFDSAYDVSSSSPGQYIIEKMCSGAYLGPSALIMIKKAAEDGIFSSCTASALISLDRLELKDMDDFFFGPFRSDTKLGNLMTQCSAPASDYDSLYLLLDAVVERSARITAAITAAAVIKSGAGRSASSPVCIVCEGTTFNKTHRLRSRFEGYLDDVLCLQRSLFFEICTPENAITIGTAAAAAAAASSAAAASPASSTATSL